MGIGARLALVGDLVDGHSVLEQNPHVPPSASSCLRRQEMIVGFRRPHNGVSIGQRPPMSLQGFKR
jgi:hypothetical protein